MEATQNPTQETKKPYVPLFTLENLKLQEYAIDPLTLSEDNIKSLLNRNRTTVLDLPDPANNELTIKGRLHVKKIDNKWTLAPSYFSSKKVEINDYIKSTYISEKDKKDLEKGLGLIKKFDENQTAEEKASGIAPKKYEALVYVDQELNHLVLLRLPKIPQSIKNVTLSKEQQEMFHTGKKFLIKPKSANGRTYGLYIQYNPITGQIHTSFPNQKGASLDITTTVKVDQVTTNDPKKVATPKTTTTVAKSELPLEQAPVKNKAKVVNGVKAPKEKKEKKEKVKTTMKM